MVRLIMGANGAGKTKQLIELIHTSVESESGSVVCIEPKGDMTYDVSYNVRLVNAGEYNVDSFDCLRGFLCGLYAGNYDISHVFVDNLCKIAGSTDPKAVLEALPSVSFEGVTGLIEFDDIGDAKRDAAYIKTANTESGVWDFVKVQTVD